MKRPVELSAWNAEASLPKRVMPIVNDEGLRLSGGRGSAKCMRF